MSDAETSRWPAWLPRERRMTRSHAILWVLILLATTIDIVLTMVGTAGGLGEGNPAVRVLMGAFGPAGLWLIKFLAMVWLVGGWTFLSDRNASIFLALFAVVTVSVTAHNTLLVLEVVTTVTVW